MRFKIKPRPGYPSEIVGLAHHAGRLFGTVDAVQLRDAEFCSDGTVNGTISATWGLALDEARMKEDARPHLGTNKAFKHFRRERAVYSPLVRGVWASASCPKLTAADAADIEIFGVFVVKAPK
jgi:hypothetical protein